MMDLDALIERLQRIRAEHGNIQVWTHSDRGPRAAVAFDELTFGPACVTTVLVSQAGPRRAWGDAPQLVRERVKDPISITVLRL